MQTGFLTVTSGRLASLVSTQGDHERISTELSQQRCSQACWSGDTTISEAGCSAMLCTISFCAPWLPITLHGKHSDRASERQSNTVFCLSFKNSTKTVQKQSCVRTRGVSRTAKLAIAAPACSVPRRINSRPHVVAPYFASILDSPGSLEIACSRLAAVQASSLANPERSQPGQS